MPELALSAAAMLTTVAWKELLALGEAKRDHRVMSSTRGVRVIECSYRASVQEGRHLCIARDITARQALEERLVQSEKIESVGRLAIGDMRRQQVETSGEQQVESA